MFPLLRSDFTGEIIVRLVRLDAGGYARKGSGWTGRYFGRGHNVYCLDGEGRDPAFIRAASKSDALAKVRAAYPKAKVLR